MEQDRVPLRHAIEIQGTANTEEFALVIELMEGSRLQEHAALLVADDRARLIAVPQSLYDLHIFIGQPISLAMADMMVAAEIGGGALQPGRHYIPTCPRSEEHTSELQSL